jgi:hypothetical protein
LEKRAAHVVRPHVFACRFDTLFHIVSTGPTDDASRVINHGRNDTAPE